MVSRGGCPRHPYDSHAFSAQSRTNYFKLATPLDRKILETVQKFDDCHENKGTPAAEVHYF